MAIGDFFTGIGQGIGRGLTAVGGYDPMQQVSPEEAAKRRSEGLSALQRSLGRSAAILSGDPRRVQFAEQQMQMAEQEKKQAELNKKLDEAIDKSNLPQSQKDLLKSLNVQTKAQTLMQTYEPTKEDKKTAAMINLEAFNKIKAEGIPEEIAIAERVLIGTRQNKSEEQMKKELIASLLRQTDSLGDPIYSEQDIKDRLQLFDTLVGKTPTPIPNDDQLLNYQGYSVKKVE
jgi:hypothetical protein